MGRLIVFSLISFLMLAGAAGAATPASKPPDAAKLRALGVRVTWPVGATAPTLSAGQTLSVAVRSKRRNVAVSLVRTTASGRVMRTVASRTLRSGSFRGTLPADPPGSHYRLRLRVGGKVYWSSIVTPKPVGTVPAVVPAATPDPVPLSLECDIAMPALTTSTLTPASGRPGDRLELLIENQGPSCIEVYDRPATWERAVAGGWEPVALDCLGNVLVPNPPTCPGVLIFTLLKSGTSRVFGLFIPLGLAPGHYGATISPSNTSPFVHEVDVVT